MPVVLSEKEFKSALPAQMRKAVNPLLIMQINNTLSNEEEWENYRDSLLDYASILQQGKWKLSSYLNAVRYVGFKVMGHTNKAAYKKTFPKKFERFIQENTSEKDISSYTSMYNKTKLVNLIFEQTLIPTYILNAPKFQDAINVQVSIMNDENVSAKVRSEAANSLMIHLKPPETKKVELDIGIHTDSIIDDYKKAMSNMVEQQMILIKAGGDVKQIANAAIPIAEVVDP
jgi:hypothetical protein